MAGRLLAHEAPDSLIFAQPACEGKIEMKVIIAIAFLASSASATYSGEILGQFGEFTVERTSFACVAETDNDFGDRLGIVFARGRFNLVVYSDSLEADRAAYTLDVPVLVDDAVWSMQGEIDGSMGAIWIGTQNSLPVSRRIDLLEDLINGSNIGFLISARGEPVYSFSLRGSSEAIRFSMNSCVPML